MTQCLTQYDKERRSAVTYVMPSSMEWRSTARCNIKQRIVTVQSRKPWQISYAAWYLVVEDLCATSLNSAAQTGEMLPNFQYSMVQNRKLLHHVVFHAVQSEEVLHKAVVHGGETLYDLICSMVPEHLKRWGTEQRCTAQCVLPRRRDPRRTRQCLKRCGTGWGHTLHIIFNSGEMIDR